MTLFAGDGAASLIQMKCSSGQGGRFSFRPLNITNLSSYVQNYFRGRSKSRHEAAGSSELPLSFEQCHGGLPRFCPRSKSSNSQHLMAKLTISCRLRPISISYPHRWGLQRHSGNLLLWWVAVSSKSLCPHEPPARNSTPQKSKKMKSR